MKLCKSISKLPYFCFFHKHPISKHMFYSNPMRVGGIIHKSSHDSFGIRSKPRKHSNGINSFIYITINMLWFQSSDQYSTLWPWRPRLESHKPHEISKPATKYKSVYPTMAAVLFRTNRMLWSFVRTRYPNTCFIAFRCNWLGLCPKPGKHSPQAQETFTRLAFAPSLANIQIL